MKERFLRSSKTKTMIFYEKQEKHSFSYKTHSNHNSNSASTVAVCLFYWVRMAFSSGFVWFLVDPYGLFSWGHMAFQVGLYGFSNGAVWLY